MPYPADLQAVGRWWLLWEFGDDTMSDRDACIKAYLQHNAQIKASMPQEQLLVWQAKDGWEPLCRYTSALCSVPSPSICCKSLTLCPYCSNYQRFACHQERAAAVAVVHAMPVVSMGSYTATAAYACIVPCSLLCSVLPRCWNPTCTYESSCSRRD